MLFKSCLQLYTKRHDGPNGITDSVSQLLLRNDAYNRYVLHMLLAPTFNAAVLRSNSDVIISE